jgi:uncharacterized protein (TIGR03118 family)
MGDHFIFVTEDGTINGWQGGPVAAIRFDGSKNGAVYKGVTTATHDGQLRLYAANFFSGKVDVFDDTYAPIHESEEQFDDDDLPRGYAPFNVQADGDLVLVAYAKQDATKQNDAPGEGHGFLDAYDTAGRHRRRLVSREPLNSPWGMTITPSPFGNIGNHLLVGNFGDGHVNVFKIKGTDDAGTHEFHVEHVGQLGVAGGEPLVIQGLWSLAFHAEGNGFHANQLLFTAGPGDQQQHGVFGRLDAQ